MRQVVFHGNQQEQQELLVALANNCTCVSEVEPESGQQRITSRCAGHTAMVADQSFVDHLEFARTLRQRFLTEEFLPLPEVDRG